MHELGSLTPTARGASLRPRESKRRGWAVFAGALLCVGLCLAAREQAGTRTHGTAHPKQTPNGSIERWGKGEVEISIDDSVAEAGPEALEAIQSSFGNWLESGASLPSLSFDHTKKNESLLKPDGRNTISYGEIDLHGHKKDLALTITFLDEATGRIQESDIVINSRHTFRTDAELAGCGGEFDLESVMSHEVGHFFGLGEDTEDDTTTMYFVTKACDIQKRDLEEPDRRSMSLLYSTPMDEEDEASTGGCTLAGTTGSTPKISSFWFGALAALMLVARRTRS